MSLPVFVTSPSALAGAQAGAVVVLDGAEGRHAATVRRIGAGERVQVVDGQGRRVTGLVEQSDRDGLRLRVESVQDEPEPALRLVLVQALAKGGRDDQAVETATELGVDAIVPWQAQRSIVQWRGDRGERSRRGWVDETVAAGKQSRRARFPEVRPLVDLSGLVRAASEAALTLVLHEEATQPLTSIDLPATGEVLVVVGPEGGVTPAELEALRGAGAQIVRLGDTVLRSSSAGPAALAVLLSRTRWSI